MQITRTVPTYFRDLDSFIQRISEHSDANAQGVQCEIEDLCKSTLLQPTTKRHTFITSLVPGRVTVETSKTGFFSSETSTVKFINIGSIDKPNFVFETPDARIDVARAPKLGSAPFRLARVALAILQNPRLLPKEEGLAARRIHVTIDIVDSGEVTKCEYIYFTSPTKLRSKL